MAPGGPEALPALRAPRMVTSCCRKLSTRSVSPFSPIESISGELGQKMNQKYDYNAWKDRLDELQNWWGKKFELQLEEFFKAEGELLQREPELKNRKTPDFLIEDDEGNRCYVEAKVRHNSIEEDRYFDDWIVGKLMDHKSVDGKGIGVHRVSGIPESEPDLGSLLQEIYDWLGTFSSGDFEELKERDLRSKVFSLPGIEIELVATRANDTGSLFTYASRSNGGTIRGHESTWLSEKAGEATKKYTPELLGGVPLVLAVLNLSHTSMGDSDIYGSQFLRIDKETDNVVESGFNGLGIWHGNERKEKLSTLHGIWLWDHPRASPLGRPTLYANLEIEGLILPRTLYKFKHNTRGRREGQQVQIIRGDGNATCDPTVLIEAWEGYHRKRPDEVL